MLIYICESDSNALGRYFQCYINYLLDWIVVEIADQYNFREVFVYG
jgi:hypothetical protein